jgi:hypothetical protein
LRVIKVRIQGQEFSVTNETLDRLFPHRSWRQLEPWSLERALGDRRAAGVLVTEGRRLRLATPIEEAEHRLRHGESVDETLRGALLYLAARLEPLREIAAQVQALAGEVRALREAVELEAGTTAALAREREATERFGGGGAASGAIDEYHVR